ncbi:MAG: hypothetical protein ACREHD_00685 [Pirellulales bacterium]
MKTCPACHRSVSDDATTCPHPGCGHAFAAARTGAKRPPPPPGRLAITATDTHRGSPTPTPREATAGRSRRAPLLWLGLLLLGSGLAAAALITFWHRPEPVQEVAAARSAAQSSAAQATENKSPAKSEVAKQEPPVSKSQNSDDKTQVKQTEQAKDSSAPIDEPLTAGHEEQPKPKHDEAKEPLGLVKDTPPAVIAAPPPAKLDLPKEPPLAIPSHAPTAIYAERTKPKTAESLAPYGGTAASQAAVEDGLNWLARHQGTDGHWGADCLAADPNSRCEKAHPCDGPGEAYEAAQTGLALLAFQAAGHYYFNGQRYSATVRRGVEYLVEEQASDGSIVGSQNPSPQQIAAGGNFQQYFMYEHAIATFALCEACAVAIAEGQKPDTRYLLAASRAVQFIERVQHSDGGWRYTTNPADTSDCSVSGWVMLALKTAREAKINILPPTIARMTAFFASHYAGQRTYYRSQQEPGTDAMTGVGMMAAEFFGRSPNPALIASGAAYLADGAETLRDRGALTGSDYYLWYNCTMAMFQAGGEPWNRWNNIVRDYVIALQISGAGCDRGSWPPNDRWSSRGGRIYSTALAVLTLEVYYRFQRVHGKPEDKKFFGK